MQADMKTNNLLRKTPRCDFSFISCHTETKAGTLRFFIPDIEAPTAQYVGVMVSCVMPNQSLAINMQFVMLKKYEQAKYRQSSYM